MTLLFRRCYSHYTIDRMYLSTNSLCHQVIDLVDNNLEQLSPVLFHDILSKLPSIPEEVID